MSNLRFEVDAEALSKQFEDMAKDVENDIKKGVSNLAQATHTKAMELAKERFGGNSLEDIYVKNLYWSQIDENMSVVTLYEPAMWIEEGRKSGFMEELLNGKSGKISKDGKRYAVIPFKHSESTGGIDTTNEPFRQTKKAAQLATEIKQALKKEGVDHKKIEYNKDGSPRLGRLHSFNFESARLKDKHKSNPMQGVSVYQTKQKDGSIRKDVMTFRVITEDHREQGLWDHPGRAPEKIIDSAFDWAMEYWERELLPTILSKYE